MISLSVTNKFDSLVNKTSLHEVFLKQPSVIRLGLLQNQIKGMRRSADDLIITSTSGEIITIHAFFTSFNGQKNDLVLDDDKGGLWLTEFGVEQGNLTYSFTGIDSIEPLLVHQNFELGLLPWILGGSVAAGLAAGGGGGGSQANTKVIDTTAPGSPTIKPTNGTIITGTAEAGSTVNIIYADYACT
jgi:hypothetical protein